jgi:hypothetical protein
MWKITCLKHNTEKVGYLAKVVVAADGAKSKISASLGLVTTEPDGIGSLVLANTTVMNIGANRLLTNVDWQAKTAR